jgi:hypothetical protein
MEDELAEASIAIERIIMLKVDPCGGRKHPRSYSSSTERRPVRGDADVGSAQTKMPGDWRPR